MADLDRRKLERLRQSEPLSPEVEQAWLRSQIQGGHLERKKVELAAWLGDREARSLLGWTFNNLVDLDWGCHDGLGPILPESAQQDRWLCDLITRCVYQTQIVWLVRASAAASRLVQQINWACAETSPELDGLESPVIRRHVESIAHALNSVDDWILCPCRRHQLICEGIQWSSGLAGWVEASLDLITGVSGNEDVAHVRGRTFRAAIAQTEEVVVRAAVSEELIGWAMERADPVALRVQARG